MITTTLLWTALVLLAALVVMAIIVKTIRRIVRGPAAAAEADRAARLRSASSRAETAANPTRQ